MRLFRIQALIPLALLVAACRGDVNSPRPQQSALLATTELGASQVLALSNFVRDDYIAEVKGGCSVQRVSSADVAGREVSARLPDGGFYSLRAVRRAALGDAKIALERGWVDGSRARILLPTSQRDKVLVVVWEAPSARARQVEFHSEVLAQRLRTLDTGAFALSCT